MKCSVAEWKESRTIARQISGSNPRLRRACQAYQIMKKRRKLAKREPAKKRSLAGGSKETFLQGIMSSVSSFFSRLTGRIAGR